MDPTARKAVNLNVLRRHDQNIVEIVDSSSYVVVYKFDNGAWTKKGVEGTLFLFKRCVQPVYGFIVMNRLGIDNFMAPLTDSMELEFKDDYIIYRTTDDDDIHGIWVFETKDRERIGRTLRECRESSKTATTPPQLTLQSPYYSSNTSTPPQGTSSNPYGRPIQIGDLLQQAETRQPSTSNNSRSSTPVCYYDTSQYDNPKKDILGELFQNAPIVDPTKTPLPANAPVTSNHNKPPLDGKVLLDMLRQNASNTTAAPPNSYPFTSHTPPPRSLSVNDTRSFHIPPVKNTFTNTPISIIPEHHTTPSKVPFGIGNPQLPRTHMLNASIDSLSILTEGINHKKILSKSEFTQQYFQLIQSDPSFMDILYQNYVVKAQNM